MKRLYIGLAAIALLGYSASSMSSSRSAVAGKLTGLMNRNMAAMTAEQYYAWKQEVDSLLNKLQGSDRMGFERRIPGLQARLSDAEVNRILADGEDAYDKIDNMLTNTPEEKAAQAQAAIQWLATDPGIDFVGKKQTYNDAAYRELLTNILAISTYAFVTNSAWIDAYANATTAAQEGMKSALLSGLSYPYTTAKLIIKRLDPSVISQLISSEQDGQTRSDISKAFTIARNIRSEQEAKNYALNKINELNTASQAMGSDADKDIKAKIKAYIDDISDTAIANNPKKEGGMMGFGGKWVENPVIRTNIESLKILFLKYDYNGVLNKLMSINGDHSSNAPTTGEKNVLYDYARNIAEELMMYYPNNDIKAIRDAAEKYRNEAASSSSLSSSSSSESSESTGSSSSTEEKTPEVVEETGESSGPAWEF